MTEDNTITTTTGDYTIRYEIEEDKVRWTIAIKGEDFITSTTENLETAIKETTELTKPD